MASAIPMIGVESGAMIIGPITVAVESVRMPAEAITADRTSILQKADRLSSCARQLPPVCRRSGSSST